MTAPRMIASIQKFGCLVDLGVGRPCVAEIPEHHVLIGAGREPSAVIGGTYLAFPYSDVVGKLFGYVSSRHVSHTAVALLSRYAFMPVEVGAHAR